MALVPIGQSYEVRFNTTTGQYHAVQVNGDGTETDLGAIVVGGFDLLLVDD